MSQITFKNIAVVGAGQMGSGIAQVMATKNLNVILIDKNKEQLEKAQISIQKSLEKFVSKEKITTNDKDTALANISYSSDYNNISDLDLAIEAVVENEKIENEIFATLETNCNENTIFASNTSSIPITRLAAKTSRPSKFIGMHFMNPVPLMKLVEVIPGFATQKDTTAAITALAHSLGKETTTSQDYPGFVVNRILMPMINEAFNTLLENVASAEDIDKGMMLGCNFPMGPLALADFIGLDTCLSIMNVIYTGFKDPRYRASALLQKYVEAGYLGRKTGKGVYNY